MEKILNWIKKNILGLEEPKRKKKKGRKAPAKTSVSRKKPSAAKKKLAAAVKAKKPLPRPVPIKKVPVPTAAEKKKLKKNADSLLRVSKEYLQKPVKGKAVKQVPPPAPTLEPVVVKPDGKLVGNITHFFPNVRAAIIKVKSAIVVGDQIRFVGPSTDFKITVKSMQMNRAPIEKAIKGQEIGIQVPDKVREGDEVYKIGGAKR